MRFRVTGGQDGISGIEVAEKQYNAGDELELTAKQSEWLLEQGYVEAIDASSKKSKNAPVVVEEVSTEAEVI
jgi:chitodextrinase